MNIETPIVSYEFDQSLTAAANPLPNPFIYFSHDNVVCAAL